MKRQHLGLSHYVPVSNAEGQSSRQAGASHPAAASNSAMYSPLHQLPNSSMSAHHQMYSQTSDQSSRFDPRCPPMISSLHRSHVPSGSPMHIPSPQAYQPRRVSLLRDIGRAGERDRDLSSISSSTAEGMLGFYTHGGQPHRISTPPSQPANLPGNYDRPITLMSNMPHSYQQQHFNEQPQLASGSLSARGAPPGDVKKEAGMVGMKQEMGMKVPPNRMGAQPSHLPVNQQMPPAVQRQTNMPSASNKPDQPTVPSRFEQKSKEDLVQAMEKVDKELSKVSAEIVRLQKRKTQLEESAKHPPEPEKEENLPQAAEPKPRDLWQIIYAENKKKAEKARTVLDGICPIYDMPLYNQPCDTQVFQANLKKNEKMRPKLLKFFQHRRKLSNIREKYLCAKYDEMMEMWQQNTEKIENNVKRKAKEAKTREFFEKLFPEIRKQREQQERVDRVGTRGDTCRSDADFANIVDGLSEQENHLQHMRHLAVVPPMLLDKEERRVVFINNNGFIIDPFAEFKESQQLDAWADHEKAAFKDKYVQHPKNFNLIASFIEKKSVADCILYYYLTKKANNFKGLVRKQSLKPRKPKSGKAHTSANNEQSGSGNNKDGSDKTDKDEAKKEMECETEEVKIDKPPSPRMTRARKQTMNWTEEEINLVKEGFGKHGRDFSSISRMVTNKSEQQVKNFYHNYKKKHGLDQLITESKKKKTRSRHTTLSPDVSSLTEEDSSSSSRKSSESLSVDNRSKEKMDDGGLVEKISKDRTPSPAVSSSKASVDPSESATGATTHIRTRRTAALAAAATATQDTQEKDISVKRSSDKSQAAAGEPLEKKAKKSERKSRSQKTAEQVRVELAKSEAVKDVVASLSSKSNLDEKEEISIESSDQKKQAELPKVVIGEMKDETKMEKMEAEIPDADSRKNEDAKPTAKQTPPSDELPPAPKKAPSEDHDSSATCSADEGNGPDVTTRSLETSNVASPYGFDDDSNDSPTRIRLELGRKPDATRSLPASSAPADKTTTMTTASNTALNLVSKASTTPVIVTSVFADTRPQSLPPASMVPAVPPPPQSVLTPMSSPMVLPGTGMDLSRPSSTPVYGNLSSRSNLATAAPNPTLTNVHGQAGYKPMNVSAVHWKASSSASTMFANVKNIGDLTYTAAKVPEKKPTSSLPTSPLVPSVVDLTSDNRVKQQAMHQRELAEASSANLPVSRHQYHLTHPMAASLQKDFLPVTAASSTTPSVSPAPHPRVYSEKDKHAMKDRAAVLSEAPIPVSSLRFTSTSSKSSAPSQQLPYRGTLPGASESTRPPRHVLVKEEAKQMPNPPILPPGQPYHPNPNVPMSRMPVSSYHPIMGALPVAASRPPLPTEKSAAEKVVPKHITIPGGSITQGKPVFRTQLTPTNEARDRERDSQRFAAAVSTARGAIIPGSPSPALAAHSSLHTAESARKISDALVQSGLLSSMNPASGMVGMRYSPSQVIPSSVKIERPSEPYSTPKSFTPEDLRHVVTPAGLPLHIDPHLFMSAGISPGAVAGAMHGMVFKAKGLEENLSPRALTQRSTPPPSQTKGMERKTSHTRSPAPDMPPRRQSPLVQQVAESQYKDDMKRPSSASRATPERRGMPDKSNLMGHHRVPSNPHLLTTPKQRSVASDSKPSDEPLLISPASMANTQLFAAAAATLFGMAPTEQVAMQALMGQYRHPGVMPLNAMHHAMNPGASPLVRPYLPLGGENVEKSRHNLLAHDFATKQQLLQHAAHGGLSFPGMPLQPGLGPQVSVALPSMMPPRRSDSPASMERLNFIPQHGSALHTSRASPHRSDPSRTPNPQSPLSPHLALKSHLVPGMIPYAPEGAMHPASERRKSASPQVASPGADHRTHPAFPGVSIPMDARQLSPLYHAPQVRHPQVSKPSHSMPEGLSPHDQNLLASTFGGSTPHLLRQATSPLAAPTGKAKSIKQERSLEHHESPRHPPDLPHRYVPSPDQLARSYPAHPSSDPNKSNPRWDMPGQPRSRSPMDNSQKSIAKPYNQAMMLQPGGSGSVREPIDKQSVEQLAHPAYAQQERAVKDLKTKGRTKMTTGYLINTIIDHNINQYRDTAMQDKSKQKPEDMTLQQGVERKSSDPKMKETKTPDSSIDPKLFGIPHTVGANDKTMPSTTRTTTLLEHSSDIISNMYRMDPTKSANNEAKRATGSPKQDQINTTTGRRYFDNTGSDDQSIKRSEGASRANIIIPTLTPQLFSGNDGSFESIIRDALLNSETSSSSTQSPPTTENVRQVRPDSSASARSAPTMRPTAVPFHPDKSQAASFQSSPQEAKRTVEPSRFGSNSPAPPSAPPQMFSALSFRSNPSAPPKQNPASSGRSVLSVGSTTPSGMPSSGGFHQQAPPPPSERTPIVSNQYEPLSDDEN